jgi:hypothetical protein
MLIYLNMIFISLVRMDHFYKSNAETDLVTLYYVTFIEPLTVFPMEALSLDSEQFMNNSINKVIEAKINDHFLLLRTFLHRSFVVQFKNLSHEVLEFFSES